MFIKRKTRAEKAYAYQMLVIFKRSMTYKKVFKIHAEQLYPL